MKKIYPAARHHIGKKEEVYVLKALRSGMLSGGEFVKTFEREFAKRIGARHAVAVSSGTAGLHIALIAAGVKQGDEVITTPFSFVASTNAILHAGATPVFVDIDPITYNIDPKKIEDAITKRTKAILPVHIFGHPAEMREIMRIARKHKLVVVEDACESLDASYRGKKTGTFGQSAVFAFFPNKQMTTGEGGMVVTNDKKVDAHLRSLRHQGHPPHTRFDAVVLGYNYRLNEMSAALGVAQLEQLDFLIDKRRELAEWYSNALAHLSDHISLPTVAPHVTHTWFVYVVRITDPSISRDAVIAELENEGVMTKPYFPSIHMHTYHRKLFKLKKNAFPISEAASKNTFTLPFYIGLTKKDVAHIAATLDRVLKRHSR